MLWVMFSTPLSSVASHARAVQEQIQKSFGKEGSPKRVTQNVVQKGGLYFQYDFV